MIFFRHSYRCNIVQALYSKGNKIPLQCDTRRYMSLQLSRSLKSTKSYTSQQSKRLLSNVSQQADQNPKNRGILGEKTGFYMASIAIAMFGASFAAVPLYRLYCQVTGKGGQAYKDEDNKIVSMKKDTSRLITVHLNANTHSSMDWKFIPLQDRIKVNPGETSLIFYRAINNLDEPVVGVATYTVLPYEAGPYFNKIQCFCFEEQMLKPHEDVIMPVLFYIDPEFSKDPQLASADDVTLSYTFFRSKDGEFPDDIDEPIELKKH